MLRVILKFNDIEFGSQQYEILQKWIVDLVEDKSTDNLSPLRYASSAEFVSEDRIV